MQASGYVLVCSHHGHCHPRFWTAASAVFPLRRRGGIACVITHEREGERASLLAVATATSLNGLVSNRCNVCDGRGPRERRQRAACADTGFPSWKLAPGRSLPPDELCRGISPRKAANTLGPEKAEISWILAASAEAVTDRCQERSSDGARSHRLWREPEWPDRFVRSHDRVRSADARQAKARSRCSFR